MLLMDEEKYDVWKMKQSDECKKQGVKAGKEFQSKAAIKCRKVKEKAEKKLAANKELYDKDKRRND